MKVCYVSLFFELNREDWPQFKRTFDEYFESFRPFIDMFSRDDLEDYEMVLFLDKKYVERVESEFKDNTNIDVIPIDAEYMEENFPMWKTLSRERQIMQSEKLKKLIVGREHCPETHCPEYTLINHCKIDAIVDTINQGYSTAEYFCWVDFGYFAKPERIPENLIGLDKLNLDTINYTLINLPTQEDNNVEFTLSKAPERFGGFFFFGSRDKLLAYQKLYHSVLRKFQEVGIADDDQHLAMVCCFAAPALFTLHNLGGWHLALTYFSMPKEEEKQFSKPWLTRLIEADATPMCTIMNATKSDKGSGHHNYTKIYHELFKNLRDKKINLLEIGIGTVNPHILSNMTGAEAGYRPGASLRGWNEYFPHAQIYACDIDREVLEFPEERITGFYLDQTDTSCIIETFYDRFRDVQFDIIVDDGLHRFSVNWAVLKLLYAKLNPGGVYIIEDIVDYDRTVVGNPDLDWRFVTIPNPQNNVDNNIFVVQKPRKNA